MKAEIIRIRAGDTRLQMLTGLRDNKYDTARYEIGGTWGLNLRRASCVICEGLFPPIGMCCGWWDTTGAFTICHEGCRLEVAGWIAQEEVA